MTNRLLPILPLSLLAVAGLAAMLVGLHHNGTGSSGGGDTGPAYGSQPSLTQIQQAYADCNDQALIYLRDNGPGPNTDQVMQDCLTAKIGNYR